MTDSKSSNYNILKEDAEGLYQLINKYVKVQLLKDTEFFGFVHSVDPVQYSIILLVPEGDSFTINVIPGHAILDVVEVYPIPNLKLPQRKTATLTSSEDIIKQKQRLLAWFKKNLLQITESEDKILFGKVSILPPYGVSEICTDNPVVALQVRKIIENMPPDFNCN